MNLGPRGLDPDPGEMPRPSDVEEDVPYPPFSLLGAGDEVRVELDDSIDTDRPKSMTTARRYRARLSSRGGKSGKHRGRSPTGGRWLSAYALQEVDKACRRMFRMYSWEWRMSSGMSEAAPLAYWSVSCAGMSLTSRDRTFERVSKAPPRAWSTRPCRIFTSCSNVSTACLIAGSTSIISNRMPELHGSCDKCHIPFTKHDRLTHLVDQSADQDRDDLVLADTSIGRYLDCKVGDGRCVTFSRPRRWRGEGRSGGDGG